MKLFAMTQPPPDGHFYSHFGEPPPNLPQNTDEESEELTAQQIIGGYHGGKHKNTIRSGPQNKGDPDKIFPDDDGLPYDSNDLDLLPERLSATNKWEEFTQLLNEERLCGSIRHPTDDEYYAYKKHRPGEIMKNWEADAAKWARYSKQLLVRANHEKEKYLRENPVTVATPTPYRPSYGMEMYWGSPPQPMEQNNQRSQSNPDSVPYSYGRRSYQSNTRSRRFDPLSNFREGDEGLLQKDGNPAFSEPENTWHLKTKSNPSYVYPTPHSYGRRLYPGNGRSRRMDPFPNSKGDEGTLGSSGLGNPGFPVDEDPNYDDEPGPKDTESRLQGRRQENQASDNLNAAMTGVGGPPGLGSFQHPSLEPGGPLIAAKVPGNEEEIAKDYSALPQSGESGGLPPIMGGDPPSLGGEIGLPMGMGGESPAAYGENANPAPYGNRALPPQFQGRGMPPQFSGMGAPPPFQGGGGPPQFGGNTGQYEAIEGPPQYGNEGNPSQYGEGGSSQYGPPLRSGPPEYSADYPTGYQPGVPQDYGPGSQQELQQMRQEAIRSGPLRNGPNSGAFMGMGGPPGSEGMGGPPGLEGMGEPPGPEGMGGPPGPEGMGGFPGPEGMGGPPGPERMNGPYSQRGMRSPLGLRSPRGYNPAWRPRNPNVPGKNIYNSGMYRGPRGPMSYQGMGPGGPGPYRNQNLLMAGSYGYRRKSQDNITSPWIPMDRISNYSESNEAFETTYASVYNQTDTQKPGSEEPETIQGRRQVWQNPGFKDEKTPTDYGDDDAPQDEGRGNDLSQFRANPNSAFSNRAQSSQMMGRGISHQFQNQGDFRGDGGGRYIDIPQYDGTGRLPHFEGNVAQYDGGNPPQFGSALQNGPSQENRLALRSGMRYETEKGSAQYEAAEYFQDYPMGDDPGSPQGYGPGGPQNYQQMYRAPFKSKPLRYGQDPRAYMGQPSGRLGGPRGNFGSGWGPGYPKAPGRIYNPAMPGMGQGRPGPYGNYILGKQRPGTRGVNIQGMGMSSGQTLLKLAKNKLMAYKKDPLGKLSSATRVNKMQATSSTPFPSLEAELKSLGQFDDFGSPIKWVKFNSNETIDGLAHVTDPQTRSNKKHIIKGTIYVPVIDNSILNSVLTTTAAPSKSLKVAPSGNASIDNPQQYTIQTILRNLNINKTGPEDWLTMDAVVDNNINENCDGEGCQARCHKMNCESMCRGDSCASGCIGVSCNAYCRGPGCLSMCIGEYCTSKCDGENCDSRCWGKDCAATCSKFSCQMTTNGVFTRNTMSWDQAYPQYGVGQQSGDGRPMVNAVGKGIGRVRPGRPPVNYDYEGY